MSGLDGIQALDSTLGASAQVHCLGCNPESPLAGLIGNLVAEMALVNEASVMHVAPEGINRDAAGPATDVAAQEAQVVAMSDAKAAEQAAGITGV